MNTGGSMSAKIGPLALLAIIVVVVIVGLGAYAYVTIGKYIHTGSQQGIKIESANQTGTLSSVISNITGGFDTPQFAVSYSGSATVGIEGIQLSLPLVLNVSQYYNDSRASVRVSGIPLIGNLSIMQIKDGNSYYSCSQGGNNASSKYECMLQNSSNTIFNLFNFSSEGLGNATIHFRTINQSSHNGMPCTNVGGYFNYSNTTELNNLNLSSKVGQSVSAANLTFLTCVSSNRVPLTIDAFMTAKSGNSTTSATLQLGETAFSQTSSSAITDLPGPIVNSTGSSFGQNG
jgi:hypothetical protein